MVMKTYVESPWRRLASNRARTYPLSILIAGLAFRAVGADPAGEPSSAENSAPLTMVLHHFTLVKPSAARGPDLVSFEPKDKKRFLMFLQKEADGRYVAVSGQTDPQDAIMEIVERYP